MKTLIMVFYAIFFTVAMVFGQARIITGTVTDESGIPVAYATITQKETANRVAANVLGEFSIKVTGTIFLEVSAAGYQTKTVSSDQSPLHIILVPAKTQLIEEVVVTAMGQTRNRNQVPFAAQQISGEQVSAARTNNFVNNLSGKVSGLEIRQNNGLGASSNIVLRGVKSIKGDNQALFVVDGVPYNNANLNDVDQTTGRGGYDYGNGAADLNPDDIESITVLKGAASSALYGSRGANGVIMITTKKPKSGLSVALNSGFGMGLFEKSTFTRYQKKYGGGYGAYYGPNEDGYFNQFDVDGDGKPDWVVPTTEDASYGGPFDPKLLVYQWDAFDNTSPNYLKPTPWVGAKNDPTSFFQKALTANQSIFIRAGNEKGGFKLGYTRNDDRGILPNGRLTKNLLSFGASYDLTQKLTAGFDGNFSNVVGLGRYGTGYNDKNLMTNFRQWWQTNVDVLAQKAAYMRTGKNITWNWADPSSPKGLVPIYWDNPYWIRWENFQNDQRNRTFGNARLAYQVADWLHLLGRVGLDTYGELQEERKAVGSIGVPLYRRMNRARTETNFDFLANVDKAFSSSFTFKGLFGSNLRREKENLVDAQTNGGLAIPKMYALSNSLNSMVPPIEVEKTREVFGVFAGATLVWRNKLTLDATLRRDQSSTLLKGNNIYYYPSASLGYAFSEDLKQVSWLSYGKFRVNYAEVGNDAPMQVIYDVFNIKPPFDGRPQATLPEIKNFLNLLPERTKSAELGLEMSFLKNRLGFDIAYYHTRSINQILPLPVSTSTGYAYKYMNAGTISNKGIELSFNGSPYRSTDFSWDWTINWSKNINRVEQLFQNNTNFMLALFQGGVSLNATLGQPYGTIRGSDFVYKNGQKLVKSNGLYQTSPTSDQVIGNPNPDWIGSMHHLLRYKNLGLSFLVDARKGGQLFSLDMAYGLGTGLYPETVAINDKGNPSRNAINDGGGVILPGVTSDGSPNTIRVRNGYDLYGKSKNPASRFIYDASFVKLRETILSYMLPAKLFDGSRFIKGVALSLVGRNIWIIYKKVPYSDPEDGISAGNLQGYQGGSYPAVRSFSFNIKMNF